MTISKDLEAKILRYYHVEKWRVGTISRHLSVHHSVVKRVLTQSGIPKNKVLTRESIIEPFLPFILETLDKYPDLTASCLYGMVQERGYRGGPDHFRHLISCYRPLRHAEAYLRLKTLPGEQAQVDWGHFGTIKIGNAVRPLMAFVMVLSYSRKIFLRFYLNQQQANFLRGHQSAFHAWGGLPRVILYDNLKSAVLERQGDAIRFHPVLLEFSSHYRFEPRPVAVARGNEKGRVERGIRYIRDNFFAAREWLDIDDLNEQAQRWCEGQAANRPCPEDKSQTVRCVFEQEKASLMALPDTPYQTHEREEVRVGKTPYVRFDWNDYSVPADSVRQTLTVVATLQIVTILKEGKTIAEHVRCYDKGKQIEDESHIDDLIKQKKQARQHRGQHRLAMMVPDIDILLKKSAERHYHLKSIIKSLLLLLDDYGAADMERAVKEALENDTLHPNSLRLYLHRYREERSQLPPVHLDLPNDKRLEKQTVRPHNLKFYDQLQTTLPEKKEDDK